MTLSVFGLSVIRSGRTLLHPTSLTIEARERIGVVGASGSGKSTLGHALIDDLRGQGCSVAHVPQSPEEALDPLRTMAFHWREAETGLGLQPGAADQSSLFAALNISHGDVTKRPWGWSRGMQQRFVIAMALIGQPDLIVLDEPTSALDPVVAVKSMDLLDQFLEGTQTAMVLITHDLGMAVRRVSKILVVDDGHLVETAPTEALLKRPQSAAARSLTAHRSWMSVPC
ncbi:MAG: ATP-binding cassette domain-containing protein [Pseudomonadota bacterium]